MTATVVRNAAVAMGRQKHHLIFPGVSVEWPAVAEYNGWSGAPVLVINLCAVFGGDHVGAVHGFVVRRHGGRTTRMGGGCCASTGDDGCAADQQIAA